MTELFCLRCGAKEKIDENTRSGWMLQFNGLICPDCHEKYPHDNRKQFT